MAQDRARPRGSSWGRGLAVLVLASLVVAGLLVAWLAGGSFRDARAITDGKATGLLPARSRLASVRRVAVIVAVAALVVASDDLYQFGQYIPLMYGSSSGVAYPNLGGRPGTAGGADDQYTAFAPGGEVSALISLRNEGELPLTVTSFDSARFRAEQSAGAFIAAVELRLPPGAAYNCDVYSSGVTTADLCREAFHPFELEPQTETVLRMVLHLADCTSVVPGPDPGDRFLVELLLPADERVRNRRPAPLQVQRAGGRTGDRRADARVHRPCLRLGNGDVLMPGFVAPSIRSALGLAVLLLGLSCLVDGIAVTRRVQALPRAEPPPAHGPRRRWILGSVGIVLVIAAGAAWVEQGSYLDPLRADGPATGSGPLCLGTEPATFGGIDNVDFAAVPGGEVLYSFTLSNAAHSPVTVTGLVDPMNGSSPWLDPYLASGGLAPAGHPIDASFPPIQIGGRESARVILALSFRYCKTWLPTPTVAPSTSASEYTALGVKAGAYRELLFSTLGIQYQLLGVGRTSRVQLPAAVSFVERDNSGCPDVFGHYTPGQTQSSGAGTSP